MPLTLDDPSARCAFVRSQFPPNGGLFTDLDWRCSPDPFSLDVKTFQDLEKLGPVLLAFLRACNRLYLLSAEGRQPPWIAQWLDAGKPPELVAFARSKSLRNELPAVLRPDLLPTDDGLRLCELDSVPGGIGATAWLQETYAALGFPVAGGPRGMREGWARAFPAGDVVISEESATYKPEMQWLNGGPDSPVRVCDALAYRATDRPIYRFFEAFDLPNLPAHPQWLEAVSQGTPMTPPLKPFLEEKLWLGLLRIRPLAEFWRREMGEAYFKRMLALVPFTWVLNPEPLPPHAVHPQLEIQDWAELETFSQKQRRLVIKVSGFSPDAWGSRGVVFGHDVPAADWAVALREALAAFPTGPRILQVFESASLTSIDYWDDASQSLRSMEARARLCPYFFVGGSETKPPLAGVLATVCPSDKKALHGMRDAVMTTVVSA